VNDFKPMQERLGEAIDTYKTTQILGSSDELWEAIHFLEWMEKDNFIFLGMREYKFEGGVEEGELSPHEGTGLGLLTDPEVRVLRRGSEFVQITPEIREFLKKPEPLIIAKANVKSTVHRRVHMDYVGAKLYDDDGNMIGELRIVGLFASTAYTEPVSTIPFLRRKVASRAWPAPATIRKAIPAARCETCWKHFRAMNFSRSTATALRLFNRHPPTGRTAAHPRSVPSGQV
jgi:glutamate dehydrogenase